MKCNRENMQKVFRWMSPAFICLLTFAGCATQATHQTLQSDPASATGIQRLIQQGDAASVHYICRLRSGEVAAATDPVAESERKSKIYIERDETGPLAVRAISPSEAVQQDATPLTARSSDEEILVQIATALVGMKEGEKRTLEIKAQDAPAEKSSQYIARLARVRTQPKVIVIQKHTYELLMNKSPEIGQAYTYDTDFPGTVESVSETDVTVRISSSPGSVKETLLGPGRVREEGDNYVMEIDARTGALVRAAGMVGRITSVDDKVVTVDFGNPFGGETLLCDVTIDKIIDAQTARIGE
jgi:FKBP-type peptidyl-prolyl cis-trans isomerase 2